MTAEIWALLVKGVGDVKDLLEVAAESYDLSEEQLTAAHRALRDARLRQQAEIGDYHCRTVAAFDELDAHGIVARADFTCCGTCAWAEIAAEADDSRHWRGYVYFHTQDTDYLVESGETYIGFGAFAPEDFDEDAFDRLSEQAQQELYFRDVTGMLDEVVFPIVRRHGIEPQWNREMGTRILLTNADWYAPIAG